MAWAQDIAINTLWYNNGAGNDPSEDTPPTNVVNGAVAVNTADGLMWVKVTNGDVTGGWEAVGGVPNPVTVALGGTGVQTLTQDGVLIGNGTDAVTAVNPLTVATGGTGVQTFTQNGVLIGNAANAITAVDLSTAGSLLIGDGSGNPSALAKGSNGTVLTTNGSGVVEWAAGGSGDVTLTGQQTLTNKTLTNPTISGNLAFFYAQHSHANSISGGSTSTAAYGVYSGNGSSGGKTISPGVNTIKTVFIWEKPSSWVDATSGNRLTSAYKFYIAQRTFGDYSGEGHMAIHQPYNNAFYGGRISIVDGSFLVYHSGTYWTGSANSVNANGTDYYWLALGG